jgi:hypothetical protein
LRVSCGAQGKQESDNKKMAHSECIMPPLALVRGAVRRRSAVTFPGGLTTFASPALHLCGLITQPVGFRNQQLLARRVLLQIRLHP